MSERVVVLTLPVPPSANRLWRTGKGRTYAAPAYRAWLAKARILIRNQYRGQPLAGPVELTVLWFRTARRGDLDNKLKPIGDALRGLVYRDDRQVATIVAHRHEAARDSMEVAVRPAVAA